MHWSHHATDLREGDGDPVRAPTLPARARHARRQHHREEGREGRTDGDTEMDMYGRFKKRTTRTMARKCFGDGGGGGSSSSVLLLLGAGPAPAPARWRFSGGRGGGGAPPPSPTATDSALLGAIGRTRTPSTQPGRSLPLLLCSLAPPLVLAVRRRVGGDRGAKAEARSSQQAMQSS